MYEIIDASPLNNKRKLFYSGHCEAYVSKKTTYYRHKAEFYNEFNLTWYSQKGHCATEEGEG